MKMIVAGTLACMCLTTVQAQEKSEAPKGKAIIQVFGNFHTGFGADNDDRGFELDRSYLGYQYDLGKGISVKGVMDVGQSDDVNDYHRIAYIAIYFSHITISKSRYINASLLYNCYNHYPEYLSNLMLSLSPYNRLFLILD